MDDEMPIDAALLEDVATAIKHARWFAYSRRGNPEDQATDDQHRTMAHALIEDFERFGWTRAMSAPAPGMEAMTIREQVAAFLIGRGIGRVEAGYCAQEIAALQTAERGKA